MVGIDQCDLSGRFFALTNDGILEGDRIYFDAKYCETVRDIILQAMILLPVTECFAEQYDTEKEPHSQANMQIIRPSRMAIIMRNVQIASLRSTRGTTSMLQNGN
jgi:hypothetical protein